MGGGDACSDRGDAVAARLEPKVNEGEGSNGERNGEEVEEEEEEDVDAACSSGSTLFFLGGRSRSCLCWRDAPSRLEPANGGLALRRVGVGVGDGDGEKEGTKDRFEASAC